MGQLNICNSIYRKDDNEINWENYILDTLSTEYTQQAFIDNSRSS